MVNGGTFPRMVTRIFPTLICDIDGSEDDVTTHVIRVDREEREIDACAHCWAGIAEWWTEIKSQGRRATAAANGTARKRKQPPTDKTSRSRAAAAV